MELKEFKEKAEASIGWLAGEYQTLRTGNASLSVLDGIMVESYGSKVPIKNIASLSIEGGKSILITPWDNSLVPNIENAIMNSDIGVSVSTAEKSVRVSFPEMTSEVREMVIKQAKKKLEEARVALRNERDKAINELQTKEKNKEISKDEKFTIKEKVEEIVKKTQEELQKIYDTKEKELRQ